MRELQNSSDKKNRPFGIPREKPLKSSIFLIARVCNSLICLNLSGAPKMKKHILPLLIIAGVVASVGFTSDVKPKILMCNTEECGTEDSVKSHLEDTRKKVSALARDDAVVMKNYDSFAEGLDTAYRKERSMTAQEVQGVCIGVEFAAEKHRLQTRKNAEKTPYISHPIGVAHHLMEIGEVRD